MILFSKTLLLSAAILSSCSKDDDYTPPANSGSVEGYTVEVVSASKETVLIQDKTWEARAFSYNKVLKIDENKWYMWYSSWTNFNYGDYGGHLCFAHSENGKDWVKTIPGKPEKTNNILFGEISSTGRGIVEVDVFIDKNDAVYPFKMVYTAKDQDVDGQEKTFMAQSKDGIDWTGHKVIWAQKHDTQFSVIVENNNYHVFLRMWETSNGTRYRTIGDAVINPQGITLEPQKQILSADYSKSFSDLYTCSASRLTENAYVMFPTVWDPKGDKISIRTAFYINGKSVLTNQDLTRKLYQADATGWGTVAPGLISTGAPGEYWIYYIGRAASHDSGSDYTCRYYRIKVKINKDGNPFTIN